MNVPNEFGGKVAIVTGGGTGIGLAAVRRLADGGAAVVAGSNDDESLNTAERELRGAGRRVAVCHADVSSSKEVEALVDFTIERFGGVDIVVNAAAIQPYGTVEGMDEATWDRVIDVNLKSIYLTAHFAVPHLRARGGGAIINIASVQGLACQTRVAAYAASKGAALALTRAMALDHAADGIRVNAICPGSIDTPMLRFAASENKGDRSEDEVVAEWGRMHPIGRVGAASEVAELVAFLASSRAAFCTGAEYKIDGGLMAKIGVVLPD
ncbi:MAG: SDR family NAD(P)-dependent oxidoreductase [Gammaproteobacteria bacterium]